MSTSQSLVPDALAAVQSLTTAQILQRLDEMRAERRSLQVLLRAARARESAHRFSQPPDGTNSRHPRK
jgi:hypothetical protein